MMILWTFATIFLYCEFGDNVSSRFSEINDAVYTCDWHLFKFECQKILPIVLVAAQERVVIKGFGNIGFTRDKFQKVFFFFSLKFQ